MKKTMWRLFVNFEKEEAWLNEMSTKGLAFTNYFLGRYSFIDCNPGEYIYRIELLEHLPTHPESQQYLKFMEENGAEQISFWNSWAYFRKRSEDGEFEIYNDNDSKIAHFKRISTLYLCIGISELCIGCGLLGMVLNSFLSGVPPALFSIFSLGLIWSLGIALLYTWNSHRKKIKKLKQEKFVWE